MALAGKNVVILGGTGDIGSGATQYFLQESANVIVVTRSSKKVDELKKILGATSGNLHAAEGNFQTEEHAKAALASVHVVLNGKPIDHVISNLGFIYDPPGGPTASSSKDLQAALDMGLFTAFNAIKVFLPELKPRLGATYTIVSGGFAHECPEPKIWAGTVKNAALNGLTLGLATETKDDKVRVNTVCVHFRVAPIGGKLDHLGVPATDTRKLAPVFGAVVAGKEKGKVLHVPTAEDVENLVRAWSGAGVHA